MVDGGVNRWCILATSKTHPRMSPRGSEFREPQGYLPGPLPANKWSRRTTMMNCEFGSSPVCLQLPASVPAYVSGRGGGRGNVESIESDSYVLQTSPDHSGRNSRSDSTGRRCRRDMLYGTRAWRSNTALLHGSQNRRSRSH